MAVIDMLGHALTAPATPETITTFDAPIAPEIRAVQIAGATDPEVLAPYIAQLELIAVNFAKFRDGRGFSLAHRLRDRLGFKGELRAAGHLIPDQLLSLRECGFSSIDTHPAHPPEQWSDASNSVTRPRLLRLMDRASV